MNKKISKSTIISSLLAAIAFLTLAIRSSNLISRVALGIASFIFFLQWYLSYKNLRKIK